jgi:LAGLIDADG DNA endonuclease family protein
MNNFDYSFYTTTELYMGLSPWFITGLADGDGSFLFSTYKNPNRLSYVVRLKFCITQFNTPKNLEMLRLIKEKLGGSLAFDRNYVTLEIRGISDWYKVIDHFTNYPLQTSKQIHFLACCEAFNIISAKGHLSPEGLRRVVA